MSGQAETSDDVLLNFLRRSGAARISDLVAETGVTATAVRQRIQRLMADGLIERHAEKIG
ncbi:MAG: MarR family transcriptional regulator, partial [Pirellulales bacterium]